MFAGNEYLLGWLSYLAGFVIIFGVWWFLTMKIRPPELRYFFRIMMTVFFLVPWYTTEKAMYLSPAWLMAIFEGLFEGEFLRAGIPLMTALGCTAGLYFIYLLGRWIVLRSTKRRTVSVSE